jgi:hypothetical protein
VLEKQLDRLPNLKPETYLATSHCLLSARDGRSNSKLFRRKDGKDPIKMAVASSTEPLKVLD